MPKRTSIPSRSRIQALQNLHLHLARELGVDLTVVPDNMELRIFLLQLPQLLERRMGSVPSVSSTR